MWSFRDMCVLAVHSENVTCFQVGLMMSPWFLFRHLNSTNLLCDCHIAWLPGWLSMYGFEYHITAVCSYPQALRGKSIFDIPHKEFKCSKYRVK